MSSRVLDRSAHEIRSQFTQEMNNVAIDSLAGHDCILLLVHVPAGVVGQIRQQRHHPGEGRLRERHRLQQPHGHVPRFHGGLKLR